ncbi:MAG: tRNA lysidine(34) synthetase TilS [Pseudomonas sp.]
MFSSQELLRQLLPCMDAPTWWLGLSGGMDSMLLLDALTELRDNHSLPTLKALHVHHGLHADADLWVEHCMQQCRVRGVELLVERVQLSQGASIEAQARDARYQAFAAHMGSGDCLLLAHHRDDQIETLLFRMLRGTGLRGLAAMPQQRVLGVGTLVRPLLHWSRADLQAAAQQRGLQWVEDPANLDPRFARTQLRHEVVPLLRQAWAGADTALLRLAEHAAEANELLDELAESDLQSLQSFDADPWLADLPALQLTALQGLSSPRQRNLLRYWLRHQHCQAPDQRHLASLLQQLNAADDRQALWQLADARLHTGKGCLWLLPPNGLPAGSEQPLPDTATLALSAGNGLLEQRCAQGRLPWSGDWQIRYRRGGEVVRLPGRPAKDLKQLFQEAGIPAWLRPAMPLIYCDGQLVSVGGRWHDQAFATAIAASEWSLQWRPWAAGK